MEKQKQGSRRKFSLGKEEQFSISPVKFEMLAKNRVRGSKKMYKLPT